MPKRAIVYVRISRDREGAGLGVDRQRRDCEELAQRLGWRVALVHADNDLSAYSGKPRPGYLRLLEDLRAGKADAVLCWHTDRLHRSPAELEEYITVCENGDVPTMTVKAGPIDLATPSGRLVARQLGAVARYEVEHMAERQQRAKEQMAGDGKWGGGRRPFGFERDGVTVRAAEAAEIIKAAEAVVSGTSVHAVSRDLNGRTMLTSTGKAWTPNSVRTMLLRARNAGIRVHQGQEVGAAAWPAILPEDRWRAVAQLLTDDGRRTTPGPERRWLGSGIYRCGRCGGRESVRASTATSHPQGRPSFSRAVYSCKAGKHVARDALTLDGFITDLIIRRLSRDDAAELLIEVDTPDSATLRSRAIVLRARLRDIADSFGAGEMTRAQFKTANDRARSELDLVEGQMVHVGRAPILGDLLTADDVLAVWKDFHISRRRAVLDLLMQVTVHPAPKGRPRGWKPGDAYFDADSIEVMWKV